MKPYLLYLFLFSFTSVFSQDKEVVTWINEHALDLSPFSIAGLEKALESSDFKNIDASIYGFGEATHHNKEFSTLKTGFFKYLVVHKQVKTFVLEESFGACFFINEYLHGRDGDLRDLVLSFRQGIWQTEEIFALINWMKVYNEGKTLDEQISVYGNDCMFNYGIGTILKNLCKRYSIELNEREFALLELYASPSLAEKTDGFKDNQDDLAHLIVKLNQSNDLSQASTALSNFVAFINNPVQEVRDRFMFETVSKLYENKKQKVFVWAHNEHVKKTRLFRENVPSMGSLLSKKYQKNYYAVGFEFGIGSFFSYDAKEKRSTTVVLEKPIRATNSEFLFPVKQDVFFLDFEMANEIDFIRKFLSQKRDYVVIGGYGLVLDYLKYSYARDKYNELFDGLIYVKNVSRSVYLK